MLAVRALEPVDAAVVRFFDGLTANTRIVRGPHTEHLLINRGGVVIRLDVIDGTVSAGPVTLQFELPDDDRLDEQLSAIRALRETAPVARSHLQLARRLLALHAVDGRDTGASLREVATMVLRQGEWPGDGEHRKSHVRRLIITGEKMVRAGPCAILLGT